MVLFESGLKEMQGKETVDLFSVVFLVMKFTMLNIFFCFTMLSVFAEKTKLSSQSIEQLLKNFQDCSG